jgi:serine/threonine protein kinase
MGVVVDSQMSIIEFPLVRNEAVSETVSRFLQLPGVLSPQSQVQIQPADASSFVPALTQLLGNAEAVVRMKAGALLEMGQDTSFRSMNVLASLLSVFESYPQDAWFHLRARYSDTNVLDVLLERTLMLNRFDFNQRMGARHRTLLHVLAASAHEESGPWRLELCKRFVPHMDLTCLDEFGLTAADYGKKSLSEAIARFFKLQGLVLGRYRLTGAPVYSSASCSVFQVRDKRSKLQSLADQDHGSALTSDAALKKMRSKEAFWRELKIRSDAVLGEADHYVCEILRAHVVEGGVETVLDPHGEPLETNTVEATEDGYYVVMPFSPKTLASAMKLESFAGVHFPTCETIARQLIAAVHYIHGHDIVHGDVNEMNVVKIQDRWELIDFDRSVRQGERFGLDELVGRCPANSTPQVALRLLQQIPDHLILMKLREENVLPKDELERRFARFASLKKASRPEDSSKAGPTFDIFGLGLILYILFTGNSPLFRTGTDGNVDSMTEWLRLVEWEGVDETDLANKVFAKAVHGSVTRTQKDEMVQVLAACLDPNVLTRASSIDDLLKLPFFHRNYEMQGKLLFVSTPGMGLNLATNEYTYNVMSHLQTLCRKYRGAFVVAYDWAGSSSADLRDTPWFNKIFEDEHHDGKTLFMSWVKAQSQDERDAYVDEVEQILFQTMWWASYKGSVKSQIREVCQSGHEAILVRIDGGPITRVEAKNLTKLIAEAKEDLKKLGCEDPRIQLDAYETIFQFHAEVPRYLARVYGEASRSDVPSLESMQQLMLTQGKPSSSDCSSDSDQAQLAKQLDEANARTAQAINRAILAESTVAGRRGRGLHPSLANAARQLADVGLKSIAQFSDPIVNIALELCVDIAAGAPASEIAAKLLFVHSQLPPEQSMLIRAESISLDRTLEAMKDFDLNSPSFVDTVSKALHHAVAMVGDSTTNTATL